MWLPGGPQTLPGCQGGCRKLGSTIVGTSQLPATCSGLLPRRGRSFPPMPTTRLEATLAKCPEPRGHQDCWRLISHFVSAFRFVTGLQRDGCGPRGERRWHAAPGVTSCCHHCDITGIAAVAPAACGCGLGTFIKSARTSSRPVSRAVPPAAMKIFQLVFALLLLCLVPVPGEAGRGAEGGKDGACRPESAPPHSSGR